MGETAAKTRIRARAFAGNNPLEIGVDENSCHQLRGSSTLKFQVIEAGREQKAGDRELPIAIGTVKRNGGAGWQRMPNMRACRIVAANSGNVG